MFTKTKYIIFTIILIPILIFVGGFARASAATQSFAVYLSFDTVLSLSNNKHITFGLLKANQAGRYIISPDGHVRAENDGIVLGGSATAGSMNISGSSTQSVSLSVDNYKASNGAIPSAAMCSYDKGVVASCNMSSLAPPGSGKLLRIGITIDIDGEQEVATIASPSFDITVTYQ